MTHLKQFAGTLLVVGISITLQAGASAATDGPANFRIMSEQEMATHSATMRTLQGAARDEYRNAQYEQLKKRAIAQGYSMPSTPPWADAANVDTAATAAPAPLADTAAADAAAEAAARHAAMREQLELRREAMARASEAKLERPQEAATEPQEQAGQQPEGGQAAQGSPTSGIAHSEAPAAAPAMMSAAPPASTAPTPAMPPAAASAVAAEPAVTDSVAAAAAATAGADEAPRFAPPEETVTPAAPLAADAGIPADTAVADPAGQPYGNSEAMAAYRETMRARFDEYMKERQAQLEDAARRQREQHEAAMEQNRAMQANRGRFQPYPYPAMPAPGQAYGPRYPAAYPGYRTPYWQQP